MVSKLIKGQANKYCSEGTESPPLQDEHDDLHCTHRSINARRMRTRVTVLTLCVCLSGVFWRHKTVIQHGEHENKLFANLTTFSTHGFL